MAVTIILLNATLYTKLGKRLLDMVLANIAILLLSPVLLLTAILIILTDGRPVFFRQKRVGFQGREFLFVKFRTMPVGTKNVPSDQCGAIHLNWFARFLRRSNFDELPQLYNIIKGDMSIVGPRPPIPSQVELIELRRSNGALNCRPGLTGLAQVNSFSGMQVTAKAHYDGEYAKRISLFADLKVILLTLRYLMKPPPIY